MTAHDAVVNDVIRPLEDGSYLVDYGPVTLVAKAIRAGRPVGGLERFLFDAVSKQLEEVSGLLPLLRSADCHRWTEEEVGRRVEAATIPAAMIKAVRDSGDPLLTPMAAVAGAMSDRLADRLLETGATKVFVNNGGDIALRLLGDESIVMSIMHDMVPHGRQTVIRIHASDGIGGVATSGLGGRSLTMGIANGVTVFGERCATVDALATGLANSSYVEHPEVRTCLAGEIEPGSDIAELRIVTKVGLLPEDVLEKAMRQVREAAGRALDRGLCKGISIAIGQKIELVPADFFQPRVKGET